MTKAYISFNITILVGNALEKLAEMFLSKPIYYNNF